MPSWFDSPVRTAYRYLQHWMLHPYLWRYLKGGKLRSWGAKTLGESGRRGEPHLVGDGYARIGEGSGSTNVLTGSGVDEAWTTGAQLAESVLELLKAQQALHPAEPGGDLRDAPPRKLGGGGSPRRREVARRLPKGRRARHDRHGAGRADQRPLHPAPANPSRPTSASPRSKSITAAASRPRKSQQLRKECAIKGVSLHGALMQRVRLAGDPLRRPVARLAPGRLLLGGKVQAPPGYADHVVFLYPELCERCGTRICIELCSGQAITPGPRRRAGLRPREMRPLRRLLLELRAAPTRTTPSA